jgi:hypothetical protein
MNCALYYRESPQRHVAQDRRRVRATLGLAGLEPKTKLVRSWRVSDRSGATAIELVCNLSARLAGRVQVTSDCDGNHSMHQFRTHAIKVCGSRQRFQRASGMVWSPKIANSTFDETDDRLVG